MILIDFSPVIVSQAMYQAGTGNNGITDRGKLEMNEDSMRHMVLMAIRKYLRMFRAEYGPEIVIAYDSRIGYWRSDFFPPYKCNREKIREQSKFDWIGFKKYVAIIRDELKEYLPYKIIEVDKAEADDIISVLVKDNSAIFTAQKILIVSNDKDFLQLQTNNGNVFQYSPRMQKMITPKERDYESLEEHIIRGDSSDGIPNCLSDDDCFLVEGKRQVIMTQKRFEEVVNSNLKPHKYYRNKTLIDLDEIPQDIQNNIRQAYTNCTIPNRAKLLTYFIQKRISGAIDVLADF